MDAYDSHHEDLLRTVKTAKKHLEEAKRALQDFESRPKRPYQSQPNSTILEIPPRLQELWPSTRALEIWIGNYREYAECGGMDYGSGWLVETVMIRVHFGDDSWVDSYGSWADSYYNGGPCHNYYSGSTSQGRTNLMVELNNKNPASLEALWTEAQSLQSPERNPACGILALAHWAFRIVNEGRRVRGSRDHGLDSSLYFGTDLVAQALEKVGI